MKSLKYITALRRTGLRACSLCRTASSSSATVDVARVGSPAFKIASYKGYIDGKWVSAADSKTLDVLNPASEQPIARLPDMGKAETDSAIKSAATAFEHWSKRTPGERCATLRRLYDLMVKNHEALAVLLVIESGKPFEEAKVGTGTLYFTLCSP
jgi:delta 1-pyrroline-5-carboxylate dehydrogenase